MICLILLLQLLGQPMVSPPYRAPQLPENVFPPSIEPEQGGIDLQSVDTVVTIDEDGVTVDATAVITFTTKAQVTTVMHIYIDEGLTVHTLNSSVYTPVANQQVYSPFNYVTISFQEPVPQETTISVTVGYSGTLQCNPYGAHGSRYCGGNDLIRFYMAGGLFLMIMDYLDPYGTLIYDQNLTIHAPSGLDLLPSGDLISETVYPDGTVTTFTASPFNSGMNFIMLTGQFEHVEVEGTNPPARVYHLAGSDSWVNDMASWTANIFSWLDWQAQEQLPFGGVNIFKLPYLDGFPGTATYGMIYLSENYSAFGPEWFEEILAHEISHLWWGVMAYPSDMTTSMLMVEGMAIFSQYDYIYDTYYNDQDKDLWLWNKYIKNQLLLWYLTDPETLPSIVLSHSVEYPSTANEQVVWSYYKTSAFLDYLRIIIGDSAFYDGLADYIAECVPNACDAQDVQEIMENTSNKDLTAIFTQFVYNSNYPVITLGFENLPGEVKVTLTQEGMLELPIILYLETETGDIMTHTINLSSREDEFLISVTEPVVKVTLHPRLNIFYRFRSAIEGDVNFDMEVDGVDLIYSARRFGDTALTSTTPTIYDINEKFDTTYDLVIDGVIDEADLIPVLEQFGMAYGGEK